MKHLLFSFILFAAPGLPAELPEVPAHIDHEPLDRLLRRYVDDKGLVEYNTWSRSEEDVAALKSYVFQFAPVPETPAKDDDLVASLINAYNAFTLEFILDHYPVQSIRLLDKPFDGKRNEIGGQKVSVDMIEHDMLRPLIGWKVHALVVCAARSCPPLHNRAYTAETWEENMRERYRTWLAREDLNDNDPDHGSRNNGRLELSKILEWYAEDFSGDHSVENLLERFGPSDYRSFFQEGGYGIRYKSYDWGLNDQGNTGDNYRHNPLRSLF
ncbi:MAG: DUF547 domain-containing protein [Kiritimatiellae bacterium]|jgi:hypothetical protein|nr:DUF547 domain-containing protein [Kiritimatiellia bacterium]